MQQFPLHRCLIIMDTWSLCNFSYLTVITNAPFHFEKPPVAWKSQVIMPHRREAMLDAKINQLFSWVLTIKHERSVPICNHWAKSSDMRGLDTWSVGMEESPQPPEGHMKQSGKPDWLVENTLLQVCTNDWKISNPFHATLFSPGQQDVTNK